MRAVDIKFYLLTRCYNVCKVSKVLEAKLGLELRRRKVESTRKLGKWKVDR